MNEKIFNFFDKIEEIKVVRAVRSGLVMMLPILMIGSMALIAITFPLPAYQSFLTSFMGGFLFDIFTLIHGASFGMLSIFMVTAIAICYAWENRDKVRYIYGPAITSLACFFILSGVLSADFSPLEAFGARGSFTAIFSALVSTQLYCGVCKKLYFSKKIYTDGSSVDFNNSVYAILPAACVVLLFGIFNHIIIKAFNVTSFSQLFINFSGAIFENLSSSLFSGFLFVAMSSVMWFFGLHGNDVLENVALNIFAPALLLNQTAAAPTEILTKTFFDVFIFMGGCGGALSLLLSIYMFSKRKSNLKIAKMATLPMLFNINELMVFGFPIIFNPIMLIPFVLTPILSFLISYFAMYIGLVPLTTTSVAWTTPVIFNGYLATGSIYGSILQLVTISLGVLVYAPFVKIYDAEKSKHANKQFQELVEILKKSEASCETIILTELEGAGGSIAKYLVYELRGALDNNEIKVHYQPQFDSNGKCVGAEALLRWRHSLYGTLYPPLVIKIAEEAGFLLEMESYVLKTAAKDLSAITDTLGDTFKLSVNVCISTLEKEEFQSLIAEQIVIYKIKPRCLCLEITEQMVFTSGEYTDEIFASLSKMGVLTAIDDFSMGHTSMKYLQESHFDIVKLDGALVRDILTNQRSRDIIASIIYLAQSLDFVVLAEYVETEQQRSALEEIGCLLYQGFYYSPALPLDEYLEKFGGIDRSL